MTALVVLPVGLSMAWAVGSIAITLAAWVLVAQWGSPKGKRAIAVAVLAAAVAVIAPSTARASEDDDFVMRNTCSLYEPWSLMWILKGCMWP